MYYESNNSLTHYGVKGMKWGQRRYRNEDGSLTNKGKAKLEKAQAKYDKKVSKNWHKAYNKAADHANKVLIPQINEKYTKKYGEGWFKEASTNNTKEYHKYMKEYETMFNKSYQQAIVDVFGERPK